MRVTFGSIMLRGERAIWEKNRERIRKQGY